MLYWRAIPKRPRLCQSEQVDVVHPGHVHDVTPCMLSRVQHKLKDVGMWRIGDFDDVKKISQRPLHVKEAKAAKEVFMIGSGTKVRTHRDVRSLCASACCPPVYIS